jgi:GNAT superfamily N-acetyltransferase
MRLSVFTPENSQQLSIDLKKLYQNYLEEQQLTTESLQAMIEDKQTEIFVTLFNARHLGAVQVKVTGDEALLSLFCVRDITRRRGVGKNLLKEVEDNLASRQITVFKMHLNNIQEQEKIGLSLFMQTCGYQLNAGVLTKEIAINP